MTKKSKREDAYEDDYVDEVAEAPKHVKVPEELHGHVVDFLREVLRQVDEHSGHLDENHVARLRYIVKALTAE